MFAFDMLDTIDGSIMPSMSLLLRLWCSTCCRGGESVVVVAGCKMSWCDWLRPCPRAILPSLERRCGSTNGGKGA